ncbi:FAD-dependent monooxygenase [Reinekea thalattae]|uniref:FAD-binding domain-containing protein n=1 Tax=Reinekea thalattae TaxID=2593301 RepID=A0A5C8ZBM3_9GAMM|nr:FAD-dependent monooxygenase [Reinekea thalattae]TXR54296.1 hypothetical protein FME95_07105 [Reinekea thalattae]
MQPFDLAIVGGGMTGLTLLKALAPSIAAGLNVVLIEPAAMPSPTNQGGRSPSFDSRATALAEQTLAVFKALGIESVEQAISPIHEIEVSDAGHIGHLTMQAAQMSLPRFGGVISNESLGDALWQAVSGLKVQWRFEQEVEAILPLPNGHQLSLNSGEKITAQQVVLCDGGRSSLTHNLGIHSQQKDFHAVARIATVKTRDAHQHQAFERFTATGPIALLPFGDYSALVWTLPSDRADLLALDDEDAIDWLNQQLKHRLGGIEKIGEWQQYPLIQRSLTSPCIHNLMAIGNTAATLHPVAGQGFNLAIRGVTRVAALINQHYREQQALPAFEQFQQLSQLMLQDQQQTVSFSHQLIQLFGSNAPLIQLGRNLALSSLDRHPIFSKGLALAGMGLHQPLPLDQIRHQAISS